MDKPKTEKELRRFILFNIGKPIKIEYAGDQGPGNTWQNFCGVPPNSRKGPDLGDIEIKSLVIRDENIKNSSDLTIGGKTPDWNILKKYKITKDTFYHPIDYHYFMKNGSLFFDKKLRYYVSPEKRTIDWYVVPDDFPPTEPSSKSLLKFKIIFSWRIEDIIEKIRKTSITLLEKNGKYPDGTITPIRSYLIDTYPTKILELLAEGGIRYEIRYYPKKNSILYKKIKDDVKKQITDENSIEFWSKVKSLFAEQNGGDWKDYGSGFRVKRKELNRLLDLASEILN